MEMLSVGDRPESQKGPSGVIRSGNEMTGIPAVWTGYSSQVPYRRPIWRYAEMGTIPDCPGWQHGLAREYVSGLLKSCTWLPGRDHSGSSGDNFSKTFSPLFSTSCSESPAPCRPAFRYPQSRKGSALTPHRPMSQMLRSIHRQWNGPLFAWFHR